MNGLVMCGLLAVDDGDNPADFSVKMSRDEQASFRSCLIGPKVFERRRIRCYAGDPLIQPSTQAMHKRRQSGLGHYGMSETSQISEKI